MDSLGNKIKITIQNSKNKSIKVVNYFNKENELIAQKRFDNKKNWPISFTFYNTETGAISKWVYFHKGKETYKSETTFNNQNNTIEVITYHKNKPTSFLKNEFNEEGLITNFKTYNAKHKLKKSATYFYGFKE